MFIDDMRHDFLPALKEALERTFDIKIYETNIDFLFETCELTIFFNLGGSLTIHAVIPSAAILHKAPERMVYEAFLAVQDQFKTVKLKQERKRHRELADKHQRALRPPIQMPTVVYVPDQHPKVEPVEAIQASSPHPEPDSVSQACHRVVVRENLNTLLARMLSRGRRAFLGNPGAKAEKESKPDETGTAV